MAVQRWAVGGAIPQIPWAVGVYVPLCLDHPEHRVECQPRSFPFPLAQVFQDKETFAFPSWTFLALLGIPKYSAMQT